MGDKKIASTNTRTLVLVGKVGCGKSATGNSILGREAFKSEPGMTGVTRTCQMKNSTSSNDSIVNVIDTPGMFAPSVGSEEIATGREQCRELANNRIHAVILVFSISSRFSEEEETTLEWLQLYFGKKIVDYMVIVFTGADLLKDESFWKYQRRLPPPLQTIIDKCQNRVVPFNNKTNDKKTKNYQLEQLWLHVSNVIRKNGEKPYSEIPRDNQIETKLQSLNKKLAREQKARKEADEENHKLKEEAKKKAKKHKDELDGVKEKAKNDLNKCQNENRRLQNKLDESCCCTIS